MSNSIRVMARSIGVAVDAGVTGHPQDWNDAELADLVENGIRAFVRNCVTAAIALNARTPLPRQGQLERQMLTSNPVGYEDQFVILGGRLNTAKPEEFINVHQIVAKRRAANDVALVEKYGWKRDSEIPGVNQGYLLRPLAA